jgi:hypothetical protein
MLSITNLTAASADFHSIRGGSPNTTVSASGVNFNGTTTPAPGGTNPSGSSPTDDLENNVNKLITYIPALLGILGFNTLVLLSLAICALIYFVRRVKGKGKGKGNQGNTQREAYHYQRVRSQYGPQDNPPPSPSVPAMPMNDIPIQSRPNSLKSKRKGEVQDSPFTPPVEIRLDEAEGDIADPGLRPLDTNVENYPSPSSTGSIGMSPSNPDLPVPRPRFISTTTMSSDMYGRPHSLFSVSSQPLMGAGSPQSLHRPTSTYDMSMTRPRARINSNPLIDGRPDSTFSTAPLMTRGGNSSGPGSPLSERMPQSSGVDGEELMSPPRPRFISDANMGPRPDSSFSMGGGPLLRPQSKFIDASGERPFSTAM